LYNKKIRNTIIGVVLSFLLWYFVFLSDLLFSFWYRVTGASIILATYAYLNDEKKVLRSPTLKQIAYGLGSGILLYTLFYMGFNVFRRFVAGGASNVYLFRSELPLIIPASLLLVTSFCEEYFWRKYTQRNLVQFYGVKGIIITSFLYAAIHLSTNNIPLVFAALIAGVLWGILYEYTGSFWVIVFSHIAWTELIFVFLPLT